MSDADHIGDADSRRRVETGSADRTRDTRSGRSQESMPRKDPTSATLDGIATVAVDDAKLAAQPVARLCTSMTAIAHLGIGAGTIPAVSVHTLCPVLSDN